MTDLTVSAILTKNVGEPATGLTLSEIEFKLTAQNRATGVDTVIWNTENPTEEIDNVGAYIRIYTLADLDTYNYFASVHYTGVTVLDQDYVSGALLITYDHLASFDDLFSDTSVSVEDTATSLNTLKAEIELLISTL